MLIATSAAIACAFILLLTLLLHTLPRLGAPGRAVADALARTPSLDALVSLLTWVPPAALACIHGWRGVLGSILGQFAALILWCWLHELANLRHARGPRLVRFINRTVGRWNNHLALWATLMSIPAFALIRATQIIVYPVLTWTIGLPKYRTADYVNVSRHKFSGLVGHDRIWCLYCDWMTGAYSLGAEMLRNLESFWCPIKFESGKKCDNCKMDFPDITRGWVPFNGTMTDVVALMEDKYGPDARAQLPQDAKSPWFGHPVRLTINGALAEPPR